MTPASLRTTALVGTALVLTLVGCNRAPAPQGEPQAPAPAAAAAPSASTPTDAAASAQPTVFGEKLLWIDPLKACGGGQTTVVHWSKEAVANGAASIELGDTNPGVFARVGDAGEKATGDWAYPGAVVVLRGDDGVARARQVVTGPANCPAG